MATPRGARSTSKSTSVSFTATPSSSTKSKSVSQLPSSTSTPTLLVLARDLQLRLVSSSLNADLLPPSLFLWGLSSTGKSHVLQKAILLSQIPQTHIALVSATEIMCGKRPFFETLLRQLEASIHIDIHLDDEDDEERELKFDTKCDNIRQFIHKLIELNRIQQKQSGSGSGTGSSSRKNKNKNRPRPPKTLKTLIIIDEAEYLIKEHSEVLNIFSRLQEFVQFNISVIFSTTLSPMSFSLVSNMRSIPTIHFPQYSKDETLTIITQCYAPIGIGSDGNGGSCDTDTDSDDAETATLTLGIGIYVSYVNMVLNVFYQGCRDLRKLLRLCTKNWPQVRDEIGERQTTSVHKIWKLIEPQLRNDFKALNSQFLPMIERPDREQKQTPGPGLGGPGMTSTPIAGAGAGGGNTSRLTPSLSQSQSQTPSRSRARQPISEIEKMSKNLDCIPKYTRYILVASYLATHNPPSSDKRFFVKLSSKKSGGGRSKLNVGGLAGSEEAERTRALKSFELNRLKSILAFLVSYCSGGDEAWEQNVDVGVQLSSICQSRFIQQLGQDTCGNFKYRCLADYDFILDVASSVNFELDKYLYRLL